MLKTSAIAAVVLMLGLPFCTAAQAIENLEGKQPCQGNSVKEFLHGTCDKLNGFDCLPDVRIQSDGHKLKFVPFYEFRPSRRIEVESFQKESGGSGWHIYGEEETYTIPPFFQFQAPKKSFEREGEFDKKSVDEFMNGKINKLRGIDTPLYKRKETPLPPAWGGDEFVRTDGFTQSGAPYQNVNPLFEIEKLKFENLSKPQK